MPGRGDRGGKKEKPKDAKGALRRILKYLANYRKYILLLVCCAFLSNLGNLLGPRFAGKAIGAAVGEGQVDFDQVMHYAILMLIAYLGSNILSFLVNISMMRIARRVAQRMRSDIFNKLMTLPVSFFDRNQAGDIISRVSYDVDVICASLSTDIIQILTSFVTVTGSFIMMCSISLPIACCFLITTPLAIRFTKRMGKITRPLYSKRSASYGRMNGFVEEMYAGQRTILAYAHEDGVCDNYSAINHEAAEAYKNADSLGMSMGPTINFFNNLGLSMVGLLGSILLLNGSAGIDQISSFVLYSRKFSGPINEIANIINEIYSALAASERVFALLDRDEEPADQPDAVRLTDARGDVEVRNVSFGYLPGVTVLHDLNLSAESGQTIAIVGHTGAGKTTIINLLMRFYDIDTGSITVDGNEICRITMDSLRRSYAMVLQDTWVFSGTIFENIAYGKENATMDEVIAVAKAAHIHNYIMRLPEGYNTVITEGGGNISKGQKQLLTIARAMLYDTNMLILDEATSNVDTNTERQVQRAMADLMKGRTSFVIAHRLSTIQHADKILVMDHGDVVEQGTHDTLMAAKGTYYKLYAAQFE